MTKTAVLNQRFLNKTHISFSVFPKSFLKRDFSAFKTKTTINNSSNMLTIHTEYAPIIER